MKWASSLQTSTSLSNAIIRASREVNEKLDGQKADVGLLFVSSSFRTDLIDLWSSLKKELNVRHLIGCTAGGVIGAGHEIEERAAVSYTAALLPGVDVTPFHLEQDDLPDADGAPKLWRDLIAHAASPTPQFLILSDPFSLDADALIAGLDFAFPTSVKVGGLASGGFGPNENLLLTDEKIHSGGAVGLALSGDIVVEAVVAQGCRPIGEPLTVTSADGNVLTTVNNRAPLEYLQDLYETLDEQDQQLLQTSLFLGIVMDPFKKNPKQGDFLVRNIIGLDQAKGIMAIGSFLRQGQTVQFHLRDAATSRDDLKLMLGRSGASKLRMPADDERGVVLFSCVGRGRRLYGEADYDSALVKSMVGNVPVGGFFCNGEIGPVAGKTYVHGYTSAIALFSPLDKKKTAARNV